MKELSRAKSKFKTIGTYLRLCDWSLIGRSLIISCSELVADRLTSRLDALVLCFEHVEKVVINGSVVFDVPLPKITELPTMPKSSGGLKVVAVWKPTQEFWTMKFPTIEVKL
jgi:hypothetical protein